MKKTLLTLLTSICLGIVLSAVHISFTTKNIINDRIYAFSNFVSVFDASRERLSLVSKSVMENLSTKQDASITKRTKKDVNALYRDNKIDQTDRNVLSTLTHLFQSSPTLINNDYFKELSYLSVNNNLLFYRITPNEHQTYQKSIECNLSDYCALLYYNASQANASYTYDILQEPSGNIALTLTVPIVKDEKTVGSLISDIPVGNVFNQQTFIEKEYYNGKNVYSFADSDIPVLQYHKDFNIDVTNILRLKVSYLKIWLSNSSLLFQYSGLVFLILYLRLKKIEQERITQNITQGKEGFIDAQFNNFHSDIPVYNYQITESRHLKDVVTSNKENSLILIKYNLEQATQLNVVQQAHSHIVEVIGSFIRASDYLIRENSAKDELIILLPKCSTENATRVLNKVFYRLNDEAYSTHSLKLKATRLISNIQDTSSIDDAISMAKDEIFKISSDN